MGRLGSRDKKRRVEVSGTHENRGVGEQVGRQAGRQDFEIISKSTPNHFCTHEDVYKHE